MIKKRYLKKGCWICNNMEYNVDNIMGISERFCTAHNNQEIKNDHECCNDFEISNNGRKYLKIHDGELV